jgi:hypothetical protein
MRDNSRGRKSSLAERSAGIDTLKQEDTSGQSDERLVRGNVHPGVYKANPGGLPHLERLRAGSPHAAHAMHESTEARAVRPGFFMTSELEPAMVSVFLSKDPCGVLSLAPPLTQQILELLVYA